MFKSSKDYAYELKPNKMPLVDVDLHEFILWELKMMREDIKRCSCDERFLRSGNGELKNKTASRASRGN